jgi:hypothetical protein
MIERKWLADGVMELRLIGDDDGIMELTRPTEHAVYAAHLLAAQREIAARRGAPQSGRVLRFPAARGQSA